MSDYTYWENALAGTFGPVHDGDAQPGFWRKRTSRAGTFVPVAIWEHENKLVTLVDGKEADAAEQWTYVCRYPITEAQYHERLKSGSWHDEDESVAASLAPPSTGHNNPPTDEAEIIKGQIDAATAGADAYSEIRDDETAAKAQSLRSRLNELSGTADKKRDAEKRPHLEAGRVIDAKWQPLVKAAKAAADAIAKALSAHETRKAREAERIRQEAEAKARKAEQERREAEEAARRAAAEAAESGKPIEEVPPLPEPVTPSPPLPATEPVTAIRGAYGRAASVKIVKVTTVKDQDAAYGFLKTHKEMIELIAKLSQRAVDAGYEVPGVTVEEQRKVA